MSEIVRIANPTLDKQNKKKSHTGSTASTASTESNTTIESNSTTSPISLNENAPTDNAPWYGTVYKGFGTLAQNTGNFVTNAAQNTGKFVNDTTQNAIEYVNNKIGVPKQIIKEDSKVLVKYMKHKDQDWFPAYIEGVYGPTLPKGVEGKFFYIKYLDGAREDYVPKERICLLYPDFTEEEENKYEELYDDYPFDKVEDDKAFDHITDQQFRSYIIRFKIFKKYRKYFAPGNGFNIKGLNNYNKDTYLSKEHKKEMKKVLIKGGKSRKHRKSHKHTKSRKQRKSRKHRK